MQFSGPFRRKQVTLREDKHEADAPFMAILGFSVIGLLLALILAELSMQDGLISTKLLLILMAAPVAAVLGFTLGGSNER